MDGAIFALVFWAALIGAVIYFLRRRKKPQPRYHVDIEVPESAKNDPRYAEAMPQIQAAIDKINAQQDGKD